MISICFLASNLLFVESPAGVGWSYSNTTTDYTCGDDSTGKVNRPYSFSIYIYIYMYVRGLYACNLMSAS